MFRNIEFPQMAEKVPEGKIGEAEITHFEVSQRDADFTSIRAAVNPGRGEFVRAGKYARLRVKGHLMMTDTQMERDTNSRFVRAATGHVLIAGLGLGMILWPLLEKPEVTKVTVVELSPDVITLVGPHCPKDPRLEIVQSDIYEYVPPKGTKYGTVYFDIWAEQSTDALKDMARLHRKFARCRTPGAYMDSWRRGMLQGFKAREGRARWA